MRKTITTLAVLFGLLFGARETYAFSGAIFPQEIGEGTQIEAVRLDSTPSAGDTVHLETLTQGYYDCIGTSWSPPIEMDDTLLVKAEKIIGSDTLRTWCKRRYGEDDGDMPTIFLDDPTDGQKSLAILVALINGNERDTVQAKIVNYETRDSIYDIAITGGFGDLRAYFDNFATDAANFPSGWNQGDSIIAYFNDGCGNGGIASARIDTTNGMFTYLQPEILTLESLGITQEGLENKINSYQLKTYPNPFNSSTTIGYSLQDPADVRLDVFDINGRLMETLVNNYQPKGTYSAQWNPQNAGSGIYPAVLSINGNKESRLIILIK
jgi:hypothetical protein